MSANQTPLMKQYWEIKSLHRDKILLYRMGDFFEMFFEDAVVASGILGIALTQRNKKGNDDTPMCGMPHHSIAGPIKKLLAAGHKVAICDQIEDPKTAKGIVKRAVTRVLTPGMVYDLDSIEQSRSLYLASFDGGSVSFLDTTTGEAFWVNVQGPRERDRLLAVMDVAELVVSEGQAAEFNGARAVSVHADISRDTQWIPADAPESAGRLVSYIVSLANGGLLKIIKPFVARSLSGRMHLSPTVLRHLEIFGTYKGDDVGSLFHSVDRTKTSAGARLLRQWLSFPLLDEQEIRHRQELIAGWRSEPALLKRVREILSTMGDIERRLGKIALPTCGGRDLNSIAVSIRAGVEVLRVAGAQGVEDLLNALMKMSAKIEATLVDEPPISTKQGHLIRKGVTPELDDLILLTSDAHTLLAQLEEREKQTTGIPSLKVRYNSVFGYYIEVTNTHRDRVPAHYQRKQTLANAERYCTDELIELERKVLSAESRRNEIESALFEELRGEVLAASADLLRLAAACSELDVISALAWLSIEKKYARPVFGSDRKIVLEASRHPVVEQMVGDDFVANDIALDPHQVLLLTGPNMAGKSTLMRQVALTAILGQIGSFVPASAAKLPLFDAIYTRIGASDQLSDGLSTFMVEMTETATMLESSTEKSLIILDEVGRGTSTYDGLCLAQAILEFLLGDVRATTLFATHYHELTALDSIWPQIVNAHMSVIDKASEIRFLHTLVKGPAGKSYGVQVAELAGLPNKVTRRAKQLLRELETSQSSSSATAQLSLMAQVPVMESPAEAFPDKDKYLRLAKEIRNLSVTSTTPLEALNTIARWQETCRDLS